MKNLIYIALLLFPVLTFSQSVYYVSPRGDNANNGLDSSSTGAWETWQYALTNTDVAGDTCYFMEGVWYPNDNVGVVAEHNSSTGLGANGTYSNHIVFINYPGQQPILDMSQNVPPGTSVVALKIRNTTYCEFEGFDIRNNYSN